MQLSICIFNIVEPDHVIDIGSQLITLRRERICYDCNVTLDHRY